MPGKQGAMLTKDWVRAWGWWPVILLLSCRIQLTDAISLSAPWLVLPLALWLGHRYGKMGLAVIAISSLGLLLRVSNDFANLGGHPDVYLAALFLAWLANRPEPVETLASNRLPVWAVPLLLGLLPLSLGLWGGMLGSGIWMQVILHFKVVLYLFLFSLGLSRMPLGVSLGSLFAITLIGVLLEGLQLPPDAATWLDAKRADLPLLGLTELRYLRLEFTLDTPAKLLVATGYLLAGRSFRNVVPTTTGPVFKAVLVVVLVVLLLLGLGRQLNFWLVNVALAPDYSYARYLPAYWRWLGVAEAIPLAALITGRYLGYPGLVALLGGVVMMWGLDGWIGADFELAKIRLFLPLSTFLYLFGFGTLGIWIRELRENPTGSWWSNAWAFYLLLVLIGLIEFLSLETFFDLFRLCLLFVIVTGVSLLVSRAAKWLMPLCKRHTGWLALASFCLLLYSVLVNYQAVGEALRALIAQLYTLLPRASGHWEDLELDNRMLLASLVLVGLGVVTFSGRAVLASAGELWRDLAELRGRLIEFLRVRQWVPASQVGGEEPPESTVVTVFNRWLGRVGWACMALALIMPIAIGSQAAWQSYKKSQAQIAKRMERAAQSADIRQPSRENIDPQLLAAVAEFATSWPLKRVHTGYSRTSFDLDWYQHPDYPDERLKVWLNIATPSSRSSDASVSERRKRALTVTVTRLEQGRFGLWVETRSRGNRQREQAIGKQIEASILMRAGQLVDGRQTGSLE